LKNAVESVVADKTFKKLGEQIGEGFKAMMPDIVKDFTGAIQSIYNSTKGQGFLGGEGRMIAAIGSMRGGPIGSLSRSVLGTDILAGNNDILSTILGGGLLAGGIGGKNIIDKFGEMGSLLGKGSISKFKQGKNALERLKKRVEDRSIYGDALDEWNTLFDFSGNSKKEIKDIIGSDYKYNRNTNRVERSMVGNLKEKVASPLYKVIDKFSSLSSSIGSVIGKLGEFIFSMNGAIVALGVIASYKFAETYIAPEMEKLGKATADRVSEGGKISLEEKIIKGMMSPFVKEPPKALRWTPQQQKEIDEGKRRREKAIKEAQDFWKGTPGTLEDLYNVAPGLRPKSVKMPATFMGGLDYGKKVNLAEIYKEPFANTKFSVGDLQGMITDVLGLRGKNLSYDPLKYMYDATPDEIAKRFTEKAGFAYIDPTKKKEKKDESWMDRIERLTPSDLTTSLGRIGGATRQSAETRNRELFNIQRKSLQHLANIDRNTKGVGTWK
jgi:hypothetical protein